MPAYMTPTRTPPMCALAPVARTSTGFSWRVPLQASVTDFGSYPAMPVHHLKREHNHVA